MRRSRLTVFLLLGSLASGPGESVNAAGPADGLLKLVAADSAVTLTIEDLRGRGPEVVGSPVFQKLRDLPAARTWLDSEPFRKALKAWKDTQGALGVSLAEIRDDLLGDAIVLSLKADPAGRPDQSRGLLLLKPRNRPLIERLIRAINDAQFRDGELAGVDERVSGPVKYQVRLLKGPGRPPEFYVLLDDGTFGWSNSEEMIVSVIDRKVSGRPGLGDDPDFRKTREGLPPQSLASLFVSPRFLERTMANGPRIEGDRASAMLARYVAAVGHLGVSMVWKDGISLHSSESLTPSKLDPWLRDWLSGPARPVVLPDQVSPSTVALLSVNLDAQAVRDALLELIPEDDRPGLDNLKLALQGVLLGRDPLVDVLPRLGPGVILTFEIEPDRAARRLFPLVGVVGWSVAPGVEGLTGPIDNAMRTLLAFYAFDAKRRVEHLRVEPKAIGETRMTVLTDGLQTKFAYRVDRDRLIVGNSPEAVARFGLGSPPSTMAEVRARELPGAETFVIVDLTRLVRSIRSLRGPIVQALALRSGRPVASVNADLRDLLAVADLFGAATFTATASKDASEIRRTARLIAR